MKETYLTLIVALISAATALYGYTNERRKGRELELGKIRNKIYQDFIAHYIAAPGILRELMSDPNCPKENLAAIYAFGLANHPKFAEFLPKYIRTNTLLCIYGADGAVKAAAKTMRDSAEFAQRVRPEPPDVGALILELRKHLFAPQSANKVTEVTSAEINQLMTP